MLARYKDLLALVLRYGRSDLVKRARLEEVLGDELADVTDGDTASAEGLLLAALIIGAAMLMEVDTTFRILGYPGLAILFFSLAACGAVVLILTVFLEDD